MTGCKYSLRKIPSAVVALALLLPTMALGEFGVCPPYSKTFGPDDLAGIEAFLADINVRPGGGTVVLTSGQYDGLGVVDIANVVCFDAQGEGAEDQADVDAAGAQAVGIDRQQRHHDAHAGNGRKNGKEECAENFAVEGVHDLWVDSYPALSIQAKDEILQAIQIHGSSIAQGNHPACADERPQLLYLERSTQQRG